MKSRKKVFNPPVTETQFDNNGELVTPAEQQAATQAKKVEALKRRNRTRKVAGTAVSSVLALAGGITAGKAIDSFIDRGDTPTEDERTYERDSSDTDQIVIVDRTPEPVTEYNGPKPPVTTMEPPAVAPGDEASTGMIDRPFRDFDEEVKEGDSSITTTVPEYTDGKEEVLKTPTTTIEFPSTTLSSPYATTIPEEPIRYDVPSGDTNEGMTEQPDQTSTTSIVPEVTIP